MVVEDIRRLHLITLQSNRHVVDFVGTSSQRHVGDLSLVRQHLPGQVHVFVMSLL